MIGCAVKGGDEESAGGEELVGVGGGEVVGVLAPSIGPLPPPPPAAALGCSC